MATALEHVLGDYYGIDPETGKIERVTRTEYGKLVRGGHEFSPQTLTRGKPAEVEIQEAFGLHDVAFVPVPMRGTVLERMTIEELRKQAAETRRACCSRERRRQPD